MTTSLSRGIATVTFLRLCSLAPLTMIPLGTSHLLGVPHQLALGLFPKESPEAAKSLCRLFGRGLSLDDVILRSTWNPARQIKREQLGHLTAGAPADIAVLRQAYGDFGFVDVSGARLRGTKKLIAELTILDGINVNLI